MIPTSVQEDCVVPQAKEPRSRVRMAMLLCAGAAIAGLLLALAPRITRTIRTSYHAALFRSPDYDNMDGRHNHRRSLEAMGASGAAVFRESLADPRPDVRAQAILGLAALDVTPDDEMLRLVDDESQEVRLAAFAALLRLGCHDLERRAMAEVMRQPADFRSSVHQMDLLRVLADRRVAGAVVLLVEGMGSDKRWWRDDCYAYLVGLVGEPKHLALLDSAEGVDGLIEHGVQAEIRQWWTEARGAGTWRVLAPQDAGRQQP